MINYVFFTDRLRHLIKNLDRKPKKSSKGRTALSTLNLLLAMVYEKMRNPRLGICLNQGFLTFQSEKPESDDNPRNTSPSPCSAFQQLTQEIRNRICLKNIPTLLLFNLIFGQNL